jgi:hypothetical protein
MGAKGHKILQFSALLAVFVSAMHGVWAAPGGAEVNVILWFDTEDYLLPADDDACKRLGDLLTERGIRATFKVVGEKARVLEQRGRRDVIAALQRHDIGYHANLHSVHPTPSEYLKDCGWLDGIAEFTVREGGGAADVRRIFSKPTLACYGQPGSSWAPQAIGALKGIGVAPHGVPCYVDDGSHVGLDGRPFWYIGALNVYGMPEATTRMELHDPAAVEPAKARVKAIAERLAGEGGGLISIYYHPCEWVHREFWDSVNFARGANPPREQWKAPRQRPAEETEAALSRFAEYIDFIRALGVRWVTASDLPVLYADETRTQGVTKAEADTLAKGILENQAGIGWQVVGRKAFSAADQFELFARALSPHAPGGAATWPVRLKGLAGPDRPPADAAAGNDSTSGPAFRSTARAALDFIEHEGRMPSRVFHGPDGVSPADFLKTMAAAWMAGRGGKANPEKEAYPLPHGTRVWAEDRIAADNGRLFSGWIIHKADFTAPGLVAQARLQAWTLKPAMPVKPST